MKALNLLIVLVTFLCLTPFAQAEVPKLINYQGKLTSAEGGCVDTTVQMMFSIYPDTIGMDALWSETQSAVLVKEGIFNVLLGSVNSIPESVFTGEIRFLGVTVGDDPEMTPRKAMVSVGYAYRAANADTAGFASNAHFADSALNADMVDGKHASDFLRFIFQDSESVWGPSTGDEWLTVKACTLSSYTVTSHIIVYYDIMTNPTLDGRTSWARIAINGQEVDLISVYTGYDSSVPRPFKSRAVKIDVDNTSPLSVSVDLKSTHYVGNHTFLILGN